MSAVQPREYIAPCGSPGDLLEQAAILEPLDIPRARYLAMEFAIEGHCRDLADQRELTQALGLDIPPKQHSEPGAKAFPMLAFAPARATTGRRTRR